VDHFSDYSEIIAVLRNNPQKTLDDFWTGRDVDWGSGAKGLSLGKVSQDLVSALLRESTFDCVRQECVTKILHSVLPVL